MWEENSRKKPKKQDNSIAINLSDFLGGNDEDEEYYEIKEREEEETNYNADSSDPSTTTTTTTTTTDIHSDHNKEDPTGEIHEAPIEKHASEEGEYVGEYEGTSDFSGYGGSYEQYTNLDPYANTEGYGYYSETNMEIRNTQYGDTESQNGQNISNGDSTNPENYQISENNSVSDKISEGGDNPEGDSGERDRTDREDECGGNGNEREHDERGGDEVGNDDQGQQGGDGGD